MYTEIKPGREWNDTNGNPIHAHGGSILYHEGTYYWYGENKAYTDLEKGIWHYGVNLYSSKDLYNWKYEGIILPPSDDLKNPMHPKRIMDRPHIVYNSMTKQFVMWVKFAGTDENPTDWRKQCMGIAISEDIRKQFRLIKTIRPLGMETGDFDLYISPSDGKGYFITDRVHTEIVIADLTEDYLDVTGYYSSHFPYIGPPFAREAPAFFKRQGAYYMFTSGTTGYEPNPTQIGMTNLIHGPWKNMGNPCLADIENNSFNCQFSSVFKHPFREDLYIAVGDRWCNKMIEFNGKKEAVTKEASYIWLPVSFQDNIPYLQWKESWKVEDFPLTLEKKEWWM